MYIEQQFSIPKLKGISEKTIDEHKKLYAGYVKHSNLVQEKLASFRGDETKVYEIGELYRRFSFEYNGMRNHECYFALLSGSSALSEDSALLRAIEKQWGSLEKWRDDFISLALTRGIGWAMTSWDPVSKTLILHWIDEQHLGQLHGTTPIIALDMWEHSYVLDYFPSGKKEYVSDFITQINWSHAETAFAHAVHTE